MQLVYADKFLKSVHRLPAAIQKHLAQQLERLQKNPHDPRLHCKILSAPLVGFYSFRVTRDYRVMFRYTDDETIHLLITKHRKDVYR